MFSLTKGPGLTKLDKNFTHSLKTTLWSCVNILNWSVCEWTKSIHCETELRNTVYVVIKRSKRRVLTANGLKMSASQKTCLRSAFEKFWEELLVWHFQKIMTLDTSTFQAFDHFCFSFKCLLLLNKAHFHKCVLCSQVIAIQSHMT